MQFCEKIPKKIDNPPLRDTSFEIRFSLKIPEDAIYGLIFPICKNFFGANPEPLGILQLPLDVRKQNQDLKYQAWYRVAKDNLVMSFGPHSIVLGCLPEYIGWNEWKKFVSDIVSAIAFVDDFSKALVERISIRNINVFEKNLSEISPINFSIADNHFENQPCIFHTELKDSLNQIYVNITGQGNKLNAYTSTENTVLDIDCINIFQTNTTFDDIAKNLSLIEDLHSSVKKVFFTLLKNEFIQTLNPQYQ